ncbi:hypothetical protein SeLEV6574_g01459 [Synchytrium endobioticum]|uniref:Uncharacterized protein n=1 Tax=Synchytrium endobioticum TaxID=286115 RepID=A0A507DCY9_9FUNG|nr:hypothetical protein SeLEV6574_g01459 [Synchytrium endobioticum]
MSAIPPTSLPSPVYVNYSAPYDPPAANIIDDDWNVPKGQKSLQVGYELIIIVGTVAALIFILAVAGGTYDGRRRRKKEEAQQRLHYYRARLIEMLRTGPPQADLENMHTRSWPPATITMFEGDRVTRSAEPRKVSWDHVWESATTHMDLGHPTDLDLEGQYSNRKKTRSFSIKRIREVVPDHLKRTASIFGGKSASPAAFLEGNSSISDLDLENAPAVPLVPEKFKQSTLPNLDHDQIGMPSLAMDFTTSPIVVLANVRFPSRNPSVRSIRSVKTPIHTMLAHAAMAAQSEKMKTETIQEEVDSYGESTSCDPPSPSRRSTFKQDGGSIPPMPVLDDRAKLHEHYITTTLQSASDANGSHVARSESGSQKPAIGSESLQAKVAAAPATPFPQAPVLPNHSSLHANKMSIKAVENDPVRALAAALYGDHAISHHQQAVIASLHVTGGKTAGRLSLPSTAPSRNGSQRAKPTVVVPESGRRGRGGIDPNLATDIIRGKNKEHPLVLGLTSPTLSDVSYMEEDYD